MRKAVAIFKKQLKDTLKNKTVLIQFVMFPLLTNIMQNAVKMDDMPKNYFVILFSTMYIGMAPLTAMVEILSEEKEKNTLRVLLMSNVKAGEYLLGIGTYVFSLCMIGSVVLGIAGNYTGQEMLKFLLVMAVGTITSMLVGGAIGIYSRDQMVATSVAVPVMLVFSFLPMLSMFNETIAKVSRFTYSQQIGDLLNQLDKFTISADNAGVIGVNLGITLILFLTAYKKCGLA